MAVVAPIYEQYDTEGNLEWSATSRATGGITYLGNDLFVIVTNNNAILLFRRNAMDQTFTQEATLKSADSDTEPIVSEVEPIPKPLQAFVGVAYDRRRLFIARNNFTLPQSSGIDVYSIEATSKKILSVGSGKPSLRGATWDFNRRRQKRRGGFFYTIDNSNKLIEYKVDGNKIKIADDTVSVPTGTNEIAFDGKVFWCYKTGSTNNLFQMERDGTITDDFTISTGIDGICHDGKSICAVK